MKSNDWRPTAFADTAPGVVGEEEVDASRRERRLSLHAFVQRLVAVDALALVLVVTLIEKAFAQPLRRELVAVAIGALLLGAAVGGVGTLVMNASGPRAGARRPAGEVRAALAAAGAAFLCLVVGIVALAGFFLANWLR